MRRWIWLVVWGVWACSAQDAAERETFVCAEDRECGPGFICHAGACAVGPRAACGADVDCDPDEICRLDADAGGRCAAPEAGRCNPAAGDAHCGAGQRCLDGACVAPCVDDRGCPEGQRCKEGECSEPPSCGPCPEGTVCGLAGACVPGCATDDGCPAGEICEAEACRAGCRDDGGCLGGGDICVDTRCEPGCRADADCGAGRCVNHVCGPECAGDRDCGDAQRCLEGACLDVACEDGCCDGDGAILTGDACWPEQVYEYDCRGPCDDGYTKRYFPGLCAPDGRCEAADAPVADDSYACDPGLACVPDQPYGEHCLPPSDAPGCAQVNSPCRYDWQPCIGPSGTARCVVGACRAYACGGTECNDHGFGHRVGVVVDAAERFERRGDVLIDAQTGLHWAAQIHLDLTHAEAHAWCRTVTTGDGTSDWRLPTWHELLTLGAYKSRIATAIGRVLELPQGQWFWSRTIDDRGGAMVVQLRSGRAEPRRMDLPLAALCVRLPEPDAERPSATERWSAFENTAPTDPWTGFHWTSEVTGNGGAEFTHAMLGRGCAGGRFPSVVEASSLVSWHRVAGSPVSGVPLTAGGLWTDDVDGDGKRWALDVRTGQIRAYANDDPTAFGMTCIQP